jgi:hypothetical protein
MRGLSQYNISAAQPAPRPRRHAVGIFSGWPQLPSRQSASVRRPTLSTNTGAISRIRTEQKSRSAEVFGVNGAPIL